MEEDYTYTNQATVTNLKVAEGTATTTARYTDCPSGYPNSDEGAESTDECYTACTVSDFPAGSHIASVTGKNYSGANVTDTCAIATCDTGYTLTNRVVYPQGTPNLTETIGVTEAGTAYGSINHSGTYANGLGSTSQQTYGITEPDTFGVDYGSTKGRITGKALCSTQVGDNQNQTWTNPTTNATMTPEFDTQGANYCYCTIDSYTSPEAASQSLSASWVFNRALGSTSSCVASCANDCGSLLYDSYYRSLAFRAAVFASLGTPVASCDANEISITWADADQSDIDANDAGSVTYGGDIRTPRKAVHKPGKIFTGWTFNTPSGN